MTRLILALCFLALLGYAVLGFYYLPAGRWQGTIVDDVIAIATLAGTGLAAVLCVVQAGRSPR